MLEAKLLRSGSVTSLYIVAHYNPAGHIDKIGDKPGWFVEVDHRTNAMKCSCGQDDCEHMALVPVKSTEAFKPVLE